MKFSIIIPVYNVKPYLKECMDSILNQTYKDYEVILVDDGSTDGSGKLCDEYAVLENIRCIHQTNQGLSEARNHGIAAAKGEYLMFVDSDDYLLREDVLTLLSQRADGCDIVTFGWREIPDGKGPEEGRSGRTTGCDFQKTYPTGEDYLAVTLKQARLLEWYAVKMLYRRAFWMKESFSFPAGRKFEDLALTPRVVASAQRVNVVREELYGYRKSRIGSITQVAGIAGEKDKLQSTKENIQWAQGNEKLGAECKGLLCDNLSCSYYSALIDASMLGNDDRRQLIDALKEEQWICDYTLYDPQKSVAKMLKMFGYSFVVWMLGVRRQLRQRK